MDVNYQLNIMKKALLGIVMVIAIFSCQKPNIIEPKELIVPLVSSDIVIDAVSTEGSVSFVNYPVDTANLSPGFQSIDTGRFTIDTIARLHYWTFSLPQPVTLKENTFTFYIDGGEIKCTITYQFGYITVVPIRKLILSEGDHTYILAVKIFSGPFQVSLVDAYFRDPKGYYLPVSGIPKAGNYFTVN